VVFCTTILLLSKPVVGSVWLLKFHLKGLNMNLKSLIILVAFAPTFLLAQTNLPTGLSSTGMPAGIPPGIPTLMPPVPSPQNVQNAVKTVEAVSSAKPMYPGNPVTPSSVESFEKGGGGNMKSTYGNCRDGSSIC